MDNRNKKALPPGVPDWINRDESHAIQEYRWDMSETAAKGWIEESRSKANVAESTFAKPAKEESVRVRYVVGGVLLLAVGALIKIPTEIVIAGMGVLGGIYALPKAIEKWRQPKVIPPAPPQPPQLPPPG